MKSWQPPSDEAVSCRVSDGKPFDNHGSDFEAHQRFVPFDGKLDEEIHCGADAKRYSINEKTSSAISSPVQRTARPGANDPMLECCCGISLHAIHSPMERMLRALVSFSSIVLSASAMTYKGTNDKIGDESGEIVGETAAG